MREKLRVSAVVSGTAIICLLGLLAAGSAMAHVGPTALGSYSDARNDLPVRAGNIVRVDYGPFNIPAASGGTLGQIHNAIDTTAPAPCTNCYVTDIVPSLVTTPGGASQNLNTGVMMHHFLLSNAGTGKQDATCPGTGPGILGERLFASGNERTHLHLPNGFGYKQGANANWTLTYHLANRNTTATAVYIEVVYRYVASADPVRPIWLDIDGMGPSCQDSEYTIPQGYSDVHQSWTSTVNGRFVAISGHMHDVDITGSGSCTSHCPAEGEGIAVSAEVVGGPASDYYGPNPPNNPPPADLTGATMCRSEGYYGTPFGSAEWLGHLDTVNVCGIQTSVPAGAQALMYPPTAAWPASDGYPIKSGQVMRLHSEYQNDTGFSQTDAMGIMIGFLSPTEPGYPRPKGATPLYTPLVLAYNQCLAGNRVHATPLNSPSCNPGTPSSGQLTIGSPDANGKAANFVGSIRLTAVAGNVATTADEADVAYAVNITDVRNKSDLADYPGQVRVSSVNRITDRNNGPAEVGTVQDSTFGFSVPCSTTADTTVGSTCALTTTADAVSGSAATVRENRRSNWQIGQMQVYDAGADGNASTTGDNTLFAVQGFFAP